MKGRKKLVNELSWSHSRGKDLQKCARRVWLGQFGSWGGWSAKAPERARRIYWLKKSLEGRYAWAGKVVHRAAEEMVSALRLGDPLDASAAADRCVDRMRRGYLASLRGASYEAPFRLMEHHYDDPVNDEQWGSLATRVRTCVQNLYDLPLLDQLRDMPSDRWLSVEELESFDVGGVKAWLSIDLAWKTVADKNCEFYEVTDWKTGKKRPEDEEQAVLYCAYLAQKYGLPPERVRARFVYLLTGQTMVHRVSGDEIGLVRKRVSADVEEFRRMGLVVDAEGGCTAPEESWPMTDAERECAWCAYREMCGR